MTSGEELRIRLNGVDTPERGEPCFLEATERFKELAGDAVRIEHGPRLSDLCLTGTSVVPQQYNG